MKVAIYTIQSMNYGNRLQNYAVQSVLKGLGNDVYTLRTQSADEKKKMFIDRHPGLKWAGPAIPAISCLSHVWKILFRRDIIHYFEVFDLRIRKTTDYIGYLDYFIRNYDAIIVGSDQVWNINFDFISNNAFLPFPNQRKIAFSASFGVENIPFNSQIANCLNNFKSLSVRETAGARIIKSLTGRDSTVLVDPTMLLTREEWRKVARKPKGAEDGYVLTYFLSPKCDAAKAKLEEIRGGRKVYELLNPDDKTVGVAGPSEFLWLFDHADLILTDSFHACVFSFLFNKPFVVYDRNWEEGNMNSRLETLLDKFHIERKYVGSGLKNDIWEHDYIEGYQQLDFERKKAKEFLKKALKD